MAQWYNGNASWFTSCYYGKDCCGTAADIAYGRVFTDQSCGLLPQRSLCTTITIKDLCTNRSVTLWISTQCSCHAELGTCDGESYCNNQKDSGYSIPILDLSDDLMLDLHGNLSDGRVRYAVYT